MIIPARKWLLLPLNLLALLPISAAAAPGGAQDGALDPSFGDNGIVRTDIGLVNAVTGDGLALQADGKLVAVGSGLDEQGNSRQFVLARFTAVGSRDLSFGSNGIERVNLGNLRAEAKAVAIQPDGKILVAGNVDYAAAIARFTPNGVLDASFGSGGIAHLLGNATLNSLLLLPDGKIVAAGTIASDGCWARVFDPHIYSEDALITRLNADGSLDSTFGDGGNAILDFETDPTKSTEDLEGFNAVTLAPDGGLLVAGYLGRATCDFSHSPPPPTPGSIVQGELQTRYTQFALARYTSAGALDSAFGNGGVVTTTLQSGYTVANAISADADAITLAGTSNGDFALARYSLSGQLDPTFGTGGLVSTNLGADDRSTALLALDGGALIATGYRHASNGGVTFAAVGYRANGTLDSAFGENGKATLSLDPVTGTSGAAVLDPRHHRFVMVGTAYASQIALVSFTTAGKHDPTSNYGGISTLWTPGGDSTDRGNAVTLDPDGSILVVGSARGIIGVAPGQHDYLLLARYSPSGSLLTKVLREGSTTDERGEAVAVMPDKKILVGGTIGGSFALARYRPLGNIDTTFGTDGIAKIGVTGAITGVVRSLLPLADGRILAVGDGGADALLLARFSADGALDPTFGDGGVALYSTPDLHGANSAALQPDGKILVALAGAPFALARFSADGALDTSFGNGGILRQLVNPADTTEEASALAIQPDGKILAAGSGSYIPTCTSCTVPIRSYLLARFDASGNPDPAFGTSGLAWGIDRSLSDSFYFSGGKIAMLLRPDSKIVVAGRQFGLIRFNPDGSPDPTFSNAGEESPNLIVLGGIALQPDGNIVMAGTWNDYGVSRPGDLLLARVESRPSFNDVAPTDYFYDPVQALAARGVLSGYVDGSFRPFANTTRGQLAKIAVLAFDIPASKSATQMFRDVGYTHTFYSYIQTAGEHHIISGYEVAPGVLEFRPDLQVTRGQLAKIVVNAAGWDLVTPPTATFSDVPPGSTFYSFIETAVQHSIISGYSGPSGPEFRPGNNATRGQIAKIIYLATQP